MSVKKILLGLLFVDFMALTAYALYAQGLGGMVETVTANSMSILLTVDLVINLAIACVWMFFDAKSRGKNPWPYILLACTTGAGGPLLYLFNRVDADEPTFQKTASLVAA